MLSKQAVKALNGLELETPKGWGDELTYRKGELVISAGGGEHYKPITLDRLLPEILARRYTYILYPQKVSCRSDRAIHGEWWSETSAKKDAPLECALKILAEIVRREK